MTQNLTQDAFRAAALPDGWSLCSLKRAQDEHTTADAALAAFYAGFAPERVLATCRSGIACLLAGVTLPDTLGEPLHIEADYGQESRILRYLGGNCWRVTCLTEGEGDAYIAEAVHWLGSGAAGEGTVGLLHYRRYWSIDANGAMHAIASRLIGIEPVPSTETTT